MGNLMEFITNNSNTLFWILAMVVLICVEMSTAQLICIWFAIGALVAVFATMMGATVTTQLTVFAVVSALSLLFTRSLVKKLLNVKRVATNADSVIGLCGSVIEEIDNTAQTGRIRLGGLDWAARSVDGSVIHIGETVIAEMIEGVKLMVSRR